MNIYPLFKEKPLEKLYNTPIIFSLFFRCKGQNIQKTENFVFFEFLVERQMSLCYNTLT